MFKRFKRIFSTSTHAKPQKHPKKDRYVLVLSGGGTRGFYTLGILKALEESWRKEQIDAIYGVSAGAIAATYRAAGRKAQEIFERLFEITVAPSKWLHLSFSSHLLKSTLPKKYFEEDLPHTFEELHIKTYVGATDMYTANFIVFDQGEIIPPLLGSIALPGIFPSVKYQHYLLNDGGIIDNFPTSIAQRTYPHHQIIGVALNKFKEHQEPKNIVETLILTLEVMMRKDIVKRIKEIALSFYEDIDCKRLERDKRKRKKAFDQGYYSGMKALNERDTFESH